MKGKTYLTLDNEWYDVCNGLETAKTFELYLRLDGKS